MGKITPLETAGKPTPLTCRRHISVMSRKLNWTQSEINTLVDAVSDRISIIRGKFSPYLTTERKNRAWEEVMESVNACSSIKRDLKGIKKKWVDIQSQTRKKEAARRREQTKTGGGPPPDSLKAWEDKIVDVLDDDMITGLEGGFDSMIAPSEVEMRVTEANYLSVANTTCISPPECTMSSSRDCPANVTEASAQRTAHKMKDSTCKQRKPKNQEPSVASGRLLEIQEEKLQLKRQLLGLEKKKVSLLEDILKEIKSKSCFCTDSSKPSMFEVSPVIHGLTITEI
ncbi:uncharacterized protein LOC111106235 [Crassostrea virginica]